MPAFEKRQLETYHALSNALAVFSVVAWRMLLARAVSRSHPTARSRTSFSDSQLRLLQLRLKLPKPPVTAKDALLAVARLGGHLKRNGDPGWLTLGRGFEKVFLLEAGWRDALSEFCAGDPINPQPQPACTSSARPSAVTGVGPRSNFERERQKGSHR